MAGVIDGGTLPGSNIIVFLLREMVTLKIIGGYDCSFTDTPHDRFICRICHLPSREPYLSVCCGHLFCKSCLDNIKNTSTITYACPICRNTEFVTFPNKQADREIKSLHIYCTNKEKGCEWQGELNYINNHLGNSDGCQFEEVKCSNECGKMIERRCLISHVETECPRRKVNCQYCHDTGEHQFIEGQHKEECPKLPLPCPNNCKVESVPRENMEAHRKVCQLEIVICLNFCGVQFERQHLTTHMENECSNRIVECQHCHILGFHICIKGPLHINLCPKLPLPCPNKCEVGNVPREDMEAHRKECPLEMIQCEYHNVGCEVMMARKDMEKHENEKMKEHLMMTKNKLDSIQHENTKAQLAIAVKQIDNLTQLMLGNSVSSASVGVTDTKWPITLDVMATMLKLGNQLQVYPVTIKMEEYNDKKNKDMQWYSNSFYTHNRGYKMCLRVDAGGQGDGKGTHLSVYLYLMKGPHDDELTWPLRGKFKFKLLNQISDVAHYSGPLTYDDSVPNTCSCKIIKGDKSTDGWGKSKFISNNSIDKVTPQCQYLKDDCLFFQVMAKV